MQEVKISSHGKVKMGPGTLYGFIKRMLEDKLIIAVDSPIAKRKYYNLTEKGKIAFNAELQRYNEIVELAKQKKLFAEPAIAKLALAYV